MNKHKCTYVDSRYREITNLTDKNAASSAEKYFRSFYLPDETTSLNTLARRRQQFHRSRFG